MTIDFQKAVQSAIAALLVALVVGAFNVYVEVKMLRRDVDLLRAELSDLWTQANDQMQRGK